MAHLADNQGKNKQSERVGGRLRGRAPTDVGSGTEQGSGGADERPDPDTSAQLEAARDRVRECFGFTRGGLASAINVVDVALAAGQVNEDEASELERDALGLDGTANRYWATFNAVDAEAERLILRSRRARAFLTPEAEAEFAEGVRWANQLVSEANYLARKAWRELRTDVQQRAARRVEARAEAERTAAFEAEAVLAAAQLEAEERELERIRREFHEAERLCDEPSDGEWLWVRHSTPLAYELKSVKGLRGFAEDGAARVVSRRAPTLLTQCIAFEAARRALGLQSYGEAAAALLPLHALGKHEFESDGHASWLALVDRESLTPPGLRGRAREDFAAKYRARLPPELREQEMVVIAEPGESVMIVLGCGDDGWSDDEARHYVTSLNGPPRGDEYKSRWSVPQFPLWIPPSPVYLPAAAAVTTDDHDDWTTQVEPGGLRGHPTGIGPLDAILSGGYLPTGKVVTIGGRKSQGKSTLALSVLVGLGAADPDALNVYFTADEPDAEIRSRLLQKLGGFTREQARAAVGTPAEEALSPRVLVRRLPHGKTVEQAIELAFTMAEGRRMNVVFDSLQTVPARAAGKLDPVATSRACRAFVLAHVKRLRIIATSELTRGSGELRGGNELDHDADLILLTRLSKAGDALTLEVLKNRTGSGVGSSIVLGLDQGAQRIFDPAAPKPKVPASRDAEIWDRVRAKLPAKSMRALERDVDGGTEEIRACVRERVASGQVVKTTAGYSLA